MKRYVAGVAALSFFLTVLPSAVSAAPNGLAWDAVMKFAMDADPSSAQPGSFDSDFAAASAVQMPDQGSGGGIFGQINRAKAMAAAMQQMMKSGEAEHYYVAGSKERTDNLFFQTATITDCSARTITTLDLRRKTYKVESMDSPSSSGGGGGSGGSKFNDDGSRVAISVTNTALGPRDVSGVPTNGYRSDMTITTTKPSGESQTEKGNLLGYYSGNASPSVTCGGGGAAAAAPGGSAAGMAMMGKYALIMRALAAHGMSSRFTLTQSGPPLPAGRLAMFDAMTFGMQGHSVTVSTERGNVRAIGANDAAFSIPSDFTQQQ